MNPEIFHIGSLSIRWYSFLILVGILIGIFLAEKEGEKKGYSKDFIFDLGFWCIVFGLIGARLYYVIFNFSLYKNNLLEIFKLWNGGLAIHGGILAGLLTAFLYCRKKKVSLFQMTDIIVPSLLLAQAIGRWGNFFNGEAHGPMTSFENLKSLHFIPDFVIKGMQIKGVYYHPTFYYESIWCLCGFFFLVLVRKFFKQLRVGQLTGIYLVWYGIGRFFIEALRTDSLMLKSLKVAQLVSCCFFIVGIFLFVVCGLKKEKIHE